MNYQVPESDDKRIELDLVIDTSVGNTKDTNGAESKSGNRLLLPNGIKWENNSNITVSGTTNGNLSTTSLVSTANGGVSGSSLKDQRLPTVGESEYD